MSHTCRSRHFYSQMMFTNESKFEDNHFGNKFKYLQTSFYKVAAHCCNFKRVYVKVIAAFRFFFFAIVCIWFCHFYSMSRWSTVWLVFAGVKPAFALYTDLINLFSNLFAVYRKYFAVFFFFTACAYFAIFVFDFTRRAG